MIEYVKSEGIHFATIIRSDHCVENSEFFSKEHECLQLGIIKKLSGEIIQPHEHIKYLRKIEKTQEVLIIRAGSVKVDFYQNRIYQVSKVLFKGDIIILLDGGHGFSAIEDLEMIEIKQGPFLQKMDKIHFTGL